LISRLRQRAFFHVYRQRPPLSVDRAEPRKSAPIFSFRDETAFPRRRSTRGLKLSGAALDKLLLMAESGRRRIATAEQCAEVRRLAEDGSSIRAIAAHGFGDERFRGRVERILTATCWSSPRQIR
jgi:hypothetical protein